MKKKSVTKILLSVMVLLVSVAFWRMQEAIRVQSLLKLVIVLQKRQLNLQQMAHSLTQQIQILPVLQ